MRVHLKSVVHHALERGLLLAYHDAQRELNLPELSTDDTEKFVNICLEHVWDNLDLFIDFTDDDEDDIPEKRINGFGPNSTEAVSE